MNTVKPVQLEDWVCFHCSRCGNCCRDLEGQLMLEPADAYDLARVLRAQGRAESIDDLYERYAHADILESNLPALGQMLKRFNFNEDKAALFQVLHYRYYNYDLDKPFLPQYISNMATLQQFLRGRLGEV